MEKYEQLRKDHLDSRKEKNTLKSNLLGTLLGELESEVLNSSKDVDKNLLVENISKKFVKNLKTIKTDESILEIDILQKYLPKELSDDEILNVLKLINLESIKDPGRKMGIAQSHLKGKANGKDVARLVKQYYS